MDLFTLLVIILVLISGFVALYLFFKSDLQSLRQSLDSTQGAVNSSLANNTRDIHDRLLQATREIGELKREAGAITELGRGMKELHEFLRSPKLRGNIGEMVLKDLIAQMFPKSSYRLQYQFKSGDKVDVAIKTDAGLLPVDSKFPMENFQRLASSSGDERVSHQKAFIRDIRAHISTIAKKYILPAENTLDFALMYIPSESVFYELAGIEELMTYSRAQRVYPVSPNTLYAALQTILLSFEGRKIESKAKEVFTALRAISKDYDKVAGDLATLGTHLKSASNKFSDVDSRFGSLGRKLSSTRSLTASQDKLLTD